MQSVGSCSGNTDWRRILWVELMLREICYQASDGAIRQVLRKPPRSLVELYQRKLERVYKVTPFHEALSALKFVAVAVRPLTLAELQDALAVEPYAEGSQPGRLINDRARILTWCEGLLVREELSDEVRFAHSSIIPAIFEHRHYSGPTGRPHPLDIQTSEKEFGIICTTYLNFNDFKGQLVKRPQLQALDPGNILRSSAAGTFPLLAKLLRERQTRKENGPKADDILARTLLDMMPDRQQCINESHHAFLSYASKHWLMYTREFVAEDRVWSSWSNLIRSESSHVWRPWGDRSWHDDTAVETAMQYIAETEHLALFHFYKDIWMLEYKFLGTLGKHIVRCGSTGLFRVLFEESSGNPWVLSLIVPIEKARIAAIKEIAEAELNIEILCEQNRQIFMMTACYDRARQGVIADVLSETETKTKTLALKSAIHCVSLEASKRLITAGASLESMDDVDRTTMMDFLLLIETPGSQIDELFMMLINAWGPDRARSVLARAVRTNRTRFIKLLMSENNRWSNSPTFDRTCILHLLAAEGDIELTMHFIEEGYDLTVIDDQGRTALDVARTAGHNELVNALRAAGAKEGTDTKDAHNSFKKTGPLGMAAPLTDQYVQEERSFLLEDPRLPERAQSL